DVEAVTTTLIALQIRPVAGDEADAATAQRQRLRPTLNAVAENRHGFIAQRGRIGVGVVEHLGQRERDYSAETCDTLRAMAETTIPEKAFAMFIDALDKANALTAERFPGELAKRQPVHTVYGGAHLFKADAAQKLGRAALSALQEYAPDESSLADAIGIDHPLADRIYPRVVDKMTREPVEDF